MNKKKLFIENLLVYGVGGVISQIIPLIMLPIVTRIMPNSSYFGISDLATTVISFGSALAVMGMYDAMYRLFFDKDEDEYKKQICSTALFMTICTSIIVFVLMIFGKNLIAKYVFGDTKYFYVVYITAMATLVSATNSIVSAPTRMQNKRKVFLVMNTISPILSYSVSIPLLLSGHYVIALPIAGVISGFTSECIFFVLNRSWFSLRRLKKQYVKPLLKIALPLMPNFLIYWIFNSCDKIMIANLLGTVDTGIYSIGSKLGLASQLIYTAFCGGWQFFAFSTMKEENQVESNSRIFEYLGIISFAATAFIFAFSELFYKIVFSEEYHSGFLIAPYLFLAPLLLMLFQVISNQFLVIKKTWPNIFILSFGAIANIGLNLWLIPKIGIEGAAISTLVGYLISDVICVVVLYCMNLIVIRYKFYISVFLTIVYILIWRFCLINNMLFSMLAAILLTICFVLLYKKDIQMISGTKNNRNIE